MAVEDKPQRALAEESLYRHVLFTGPHILGPEEPCQYSHVILGCWPLNSGNSVFKLGVSKLILNTESSSSLSWSWFKTFLQHWRNQWDQYLEGHLADDHVHRFSCREGGLAWNHLLGFSWKLFHPLSDQVNLPFCIANFSIDNSRLFSHESVHKTNEMPKSGGFKHLYGIWLPIKLSSR